MCQCTCACMHTCMQRTVLVKGSKGAIEPFLDKPADRKVVPLTFVVSPR